MIPAARLRRSATLLAVIIVVGIIGFRLIEGVAWLDAVYMVVITLSTVGFAEVFPLSTGGRILTILLIGLGVGTALYTAGAGFELAVENLGGNRERRRIMRRVADLRGHHIVCGFGRVGRATWELMLDWGAEVVVIESNPDAAAEARELGALVVEGDATHNDYLEEAGIDRAAGVVACVHNDADNLVIVLSVKSVRPELQVIARATEAEWREKLFLAGADRVVAPQLVGARRMAALALQPELSEFIDLVVDGNLMEFTVQRIEVHKGSALVGQSIRESAIRTQSGALILAVEDSTGQMDFNPEPDRVLKDGIVLVAIGSDAQVRALTQLAGGGRRR